MAIESYNENLKELNSLDSPPHDPNNSRELLRNVLEQGTGQAQSELTW